MESKYSFPNAVFNANNIAIGDNNQNLFFDENSNENYTPIEKELVSLIFQNTANDKEREELLSMLKNYRDSSEDEKDKVKPIFFKKFKDLSEKTSIATIAKIASEYFGNNFSDLKDYVEASVK
ncbi:hypothetical protein [Lacihabitans soyangensis]|uniref:Uncharacterized protein n=1 Tax=Lacihabitans soyangensis TaxID=869394 RepID=A0AAE3KTK8_9BACT|nr:hypothetical protein [Lacihabitans soyangensis]MCP9762174.1 hypothetical protein [Lacihabitans soyangensis]MCP9763164.1 hypothetical protein [Lacihabitans soyangensis]MCP9764153.1 hypothetical protein [Lacihabitans soyangensis]MCP9764225.1 hypothetical protein [Lacihabitans soyangensis]